MPFVSKDWRDPGENWVKTEEGWEKRKIVEYEGYSESDEDTANGAMSHVLKCSSGPENSILKGMHIMRLFLRLLEPSVPLKAQGWSGGESDGELNSRGLLLRRFTQPNLQVFARFEDLQCSSRLLRRRRTNSSTFVGQPHCHITLKCTKEIAGFNGLSEALKRLDFRNAIRDSQRFNYICKFLDLLITKKLATLTGGAQKMLFSMLEEVTLQVSGSQQNLHVLHRLLQSLQKRIEDYLWWGSMIGSVVLWERQRERFQRINSAANSIEINAPDESTHPTIQEIPQECVREIVKRLDNHMDIVSAGKSYSVIAQLATEQNVWKELCNFHWNRQQIEYIIRTHKELQVKRDWEHVYHRLRRTYGLRETYANMIMLCKNCQCLFWESLGHPCLVESNPEIKNRIQTGREESYTKVPPKVFLSYFSI